MKLSPIGDRLERLAYGLALCWRERWGPLAHRVTLPTLAADFLEPVIGEPVSPALVDRLLQDWGAVWHRGLYPVQGRRGGVFYHHIDVLVLRERPRVTAGPYPFQDDIQRQQAGRFDGVIPPPPALIGEDFRRYHARNQLKRAVFRDRYDRKRELSPRDQSPPTQA